MDRYGERTQRAADGPVLEVPSISLPKGGGAIRGIDETFAASPATGAGSLSVPIAVSPGRPGFGPQLALTYDSGAGNGPFGFGWSLSLPRITRKTEKGLPQYEDDRESDVFLLSGSEDLVPVLDSEGVRWSRTQSVEGRTYRIVRYRPRVEGLFARIERWTDETTREVHWRSISGENVTTVYGRTRESRVADPRNPARIFSWLICESYDAKGNAMRYSYAGENGENVDLSQQNEANRERSANRYIKRIEYGNRISRLIQPDLTTAEWLFELVFDYDEGHYEPLDPDPEHPEGEQHQRVRASVAPDRTWNVRPDPFSSYRPGFEVRTYRRCCRILMFHHFDELGEEPCLVRSTEFDYVDFDYGDAAEELAVEHELVHQGSTRFASFIQTVTQSGYVRRPDDTYVMKSLPPLEFAYSKAEIQDELSTLDEASIAQLPISPGGSGYQWVDLDGEGVSGMLIEQPEAWFYKPNLGEGRFGPAQLVGRRPALAALPAPQRQLIDLAGDGRLDLVSFERATPGFHARTDGGDWEPFKAFHALPNVDWRHPHLRFADLTGDGHADVLITEDEVFTWNPSLAKEGFGPTQRVRHASDEEEGPRLVFADGTNAIYLADMSGDGLTDLVRIRNGSVCYWPNLGYGRFGAKVAMDRAPWFDSPDQFNQGRIRLADIDGSGNTDIIYVGLFGVDLYFNQSGNRWSGPRRLTHFPRTDDLAAVTATDLLGNGTACLVWVSPLPGDAHRPVRYIDLMGGQKPHLLTAIKNNLGAETRVYYSSSTAFHLADKASGTPWITRLPFPVHVVERVEVYDYISRNRFVTRYAYHHGHFDGAERAFYGFGMVEQWDTEEFSALEAGGDLPVAVNEETASHVPPVHVKMWYHTGVFIDREHVSRLFETEYYRETGLSDEAFLAQLLPDTTLPPGLAPEEMREACRALRARLLREEVYALDGTSKAPHPYKVTEQDYAVERLQPRSGSRHAVFHARPRERIDYHYERNSADPRTIHTLNLEFDTFGNVLKEATIGYGRRQPDPDLESDDRATQAQALITYSEHSVTNSIDSDDLDGGYRTPLLCQTRTYELTGYLPEGVQEPVERFQSGDFVQPDPNEPTRLVHRFDSEIAHEDEPPLDAGRARRLIREERTLFRADDLTHLLPLGVLESLALPGEAYRLGFTPGLLAQVYRRPNATVEPPEAPEPSEPEDLLPDPAELLAGGGPDRGGYVDLDGDGRWWAPSERAFYSPEPADAPDEELAYARAHFFLPHRIRDPFHTDGAATERFVAYDSYNLLLLETRDALGNRITAGERTPAGEIDLSVVGQDYRVLQPRLVTDPNGNRTAVAFDALGMVVGTAAMGKPPPVPAEGETLDHFGADLTEAAILDFLAEPLADPHAVLQGATARWVYDLSAYRRTQFDPEPLPAVVCLLARETHTASLTPGEQSRVQLTFTYSDGFEREIQQKAPAEPGPLDEVGPNVDPRWSGTGWTIFNNKGEPVRRYEPFFTQTHRFEFAALVGVSSIVFYDPLGRVVSVLHPDHTYEKFAFDAWREARWDTNDTLLQTNPNEDPDVGDFFRRLPESAYLPTWHSARQDGSAEEASAAEKTALHAGTPTVERLDPLGRTFLSVDHNRYVEPERLPEEPPTEAFIATRFDLDIEGNQRAVRDGLGRVAMRTDYDLLGNRIHEASMEAGERWAVADALGQSLCEWDSRGHLLRTVYDALRRPAELILREGGDEEQRVQRTVYGESLPDPEVNNLRGRTVQRWDGAGVLTSDAYDFKGNLLRSERRLAVAYHEALDWSTDVPLEPESYVVRTEYDALDRPIAVTMPDGSVILRAYNEANLLDRIETHLQGGDAPTVFIQGVEYNARGQRTAITYGNGVRTEYGYDPLTFRLVSLRSRRGADILQHLRYTYDPVGNVTHIRDDAQEAIFFNNAVVAPHSEYTYDALYRLIEATGREHAGQAGAPQTTWNDEFRGGLTHPHDGQAMRRYAELYGYDAMGNILELVHLASGGTWRRAYDYDEPSQLEFDRSSNRLSATILQPGGDQPAALPHTYDVHGNVTAMPHLPSIAWDYRDQIRATARQLVQNGGTPETTYYVYDADGERVRKVTERHAGPGQTPTRRSERIYLGGFEILREYAGNGDTVTAEVETVHVMDDQQRIALVETRRVHEGSEVGTPVPRQRYQLGNDLASVLLELGQDGAVISYEEYFPFGGTAFQSVGAGALSPEVSAKRYRYTGKERDEETGLYYHGARYYAPWLGRWASADSTPVDGWNLFVYAGNNPIRFRDATGRSKEKGVLGWLGGKVVEAIGSAAKKTAKVAGKGAELAIAAASLWYEGNPSSLRGSAANSYQTVNKNEQKRLEEAQAAENRQRRPEGSGGGSSPKPKEKPPPRFDPPPTASNTVSADPVNLVQPPVDEGAKATAKKMAPPVPTVDPKDVAAPTSGGFQTKALGATGIAKRVKSHLVVNLAIAVVVGVGVAVYSGDAKAGADAAYETANPIVVTTEVLKGNLDMPIEDALMTDLMRAAAPPPEHLEASEETREISEWAWENNPAFNPAFNPKF